MAVEKIITGGQTGADQGALLAARDINIPTGGWAPKGWRTEAGPAEWLKDYKLVQASSDSYSYRTKLNVMDADGVAIFGDVGSKGSALTLRWAKEEGIPIIINPTSQQLREWVEGWEISVLMVAGNRESRCPGIEERVRGIIKRAFGE